VPDGEVVQVHSWDEAYEALLDDPWINGSFHEDVEPGTPEWSAAYQGARAAVERSGRDHELEPGNPVARSAGWDAGAAAWQIARGRTDGFYLELMRWYRRGHWPCGWRGRYPEGSLIIY
jgi:hypothetical protein